jgi:Xaa-Pro aminopeptidase
MKSDIDSLMQLNDIDALLVTGPAGHNPPMYYFTGDVHLSQADLIKKRGEAPVLFYSAIERDEAARTGLAVKSLEDYRFPELLKQTNGDLVKATVTRYQKMFADLGISEGRVALHGKIDAGAAYAVFSGLQGVLPDLSFVGQTDDSLLLKARATKDPTEVERIRHMGRITTEVVGLVADFLTSHQARDGFLVRQDGEPLTIGQVKRHINLWLAERGAENPLGTIFAMGYDAAVPHSSGNDQDALRLGETIIFDIYPCEAGGGYFYDLTRTWCLGYATDEALALYEDVLFVYQQVFSELKLGQQGGQFQQRACELFEERGHPTLRSDPNTQRGYVHGLGHGVGLDIHERPRFSRNATADDILEPGVVVTHEPGLYYPERHLGMRLEDTLWVRPDGSLEILAEYPKDLVLPIKRR